MLPMYASIQRVPFYQRYGVSLPNSLTRDDSIILVYSTNIPVSVCGTDENIPSIEDFLVSRIVRIASACASAFHHSLYTSHCWETSLRIYQQELPRCLNADLSALQHFLLRPPIGKTEYFRLSNINDMSIAYAFQPRLRTD